MRDFLNGCSEYHSVAVIGWLLHYVSGSHLPHAEYSLCQNVIPSF